MIYWVFTIWFLLSIYLIINLYRKVLMHEQWKENLQKDLEKTINAMRTIDNRGLFENDDYTGSIFKDLASTIEDVSVYTNIPPDVIKSNLVERKNGS